jgi:predicted MFS family arabinose efflux permease
VGQKFWLLIITFGSIGSFFYFRHTDEDFQKRDKLLFLLGIIFLLIGGSLILLVYDFQVLIDCLSLKEAKVAGKLILIGYMFLLISTLIYIEKLSKKLYSNRN